MFLLTQGRTGLIIQFNLIAYVFAMRTTSGLNSPNVCHCTYKHPTILLKCLDDTSHFQTKNRCTPTHHCQARKYPSNQGRNQLSVPGGRTSTFPPVCYHWRPNRYTQNILQSLSKGEDRSHCIVFSKRTNSHCCMLIWYGTTFAQALCFPYFPIVFPLCFSFFFPPRILFPLGGAPTLPTPWLRHCVQLPNT